MRREIFAIALLVLLFVGALYNISFIDNMAYTLENEVTAAAEYARSGDFDKAKSIIDSASSHWLSLDGYTHIFLRHSEIDSVTDAFFELRTSLSEEDSDAFEGSYGLLMAHLESIRTMEHLRLGSIL